jgi:hypothetical protein
MQVEQELIPIRLKCLIDTELPTGAGWGDSAIFEDSEFAPVSGWGAKRAALSGDRSTTLIP